MTNIRKYLTAYHWSMFTLSIFVLIGIFAPLLANELPLACKTPDGWIFPALLTKDRLVYSSKKMQLDECYKTLIPFGSQNTDISRSAAKSPCQSQQIGLAKHWLGTDKLGRDVASGMIHGTQTAMQIGFISVFLSFFFGVSIGMGAAYLKDEGLRLNILQILFLFISVFIFLFYGLYELKFSGFDDWIFMFYFLIFLVGNYLLFYLASLIKNLKNYFIDIDMILIKVIEIRKSFPGIFILLALTTLFVAPSVWNIIMIITLLSWTEFARFARAETLVVKNENYIVSAHLLGFDHLRILYRHILPNIMSSLIVIACFSVGSAIILEATLSYLGIGLPVEQVTWGKMMAEGRDMQLWWLVFFPGLALFIIILCLNTIADVFNRN